MVVIEAKDCIMVEDDHDVGSLQDGDHLIVVMELEDTAVAWNDPPPLPALGDLPLPALVPSVTYSESDDEWTDAEHQHPEKSEPLAKDRVAAVRTAVSPTTGGIWPVDLNDPPEARSLLGIAQMHMDPNDPTWRSDCQPETI